jgi:hypothetical protein
MAVVMLGMGVAMTAGVRLPIPMVGAASARGEVRERRTSWVRFREWRLLAAPQYSLVSSRSRASLVVSSPPWCSEWRTCSAWSHRCS